MTSTTTAPVPDELYAELGRFVVVFQWLDSQLAEILARCIAGNEWFRSLEVFAEMNFKDKVRHARAMFAAFLKKRADSQIDEPYGDRWDVRFPELMRKCESLGTKRNKLIHSFYDHIEYGEEVVAIVRTKFKTGQAERTLDQGDPAREIDAALKDIAAIAFDIMQARMQLLHWT